MRRALIIESGGVALVRFAGMGVGFLLTVVLARLLGPEALGVYGYLLLLLMLAAVPVSNGWATLLLRATSQAQANGNWAVPSGLLRWGALAAFSMTVVALLLGLIALASPWAGVTGLGVIAVFCSVLFFDQLSALRLAALRGLNRPVWGQVPEMLLRPGLILVGFLALAGWWGEPSLNLAFVALIAAAAITALLGGAVFRRLAPEALLNVRPEAKPLPWARVAGVLAANSGLVILNGQTDFLVLGVLGAAEDLGHYRVAMQIALLSGFGYAALNMIAMPRFAHLHATRDLAGLQATATFLARIAFAATVPLPVIFWLWGEEILTWIFGGSFIAVQGPLMWLFLLQILNAACGFAHTLLVMSGKELRIIPFTLASVVLNAILCMIFIPAMGAEGAGLSSVVAVGLWNILLLFKVRQNFGVDISAIGRWQSIRSLP